MRKMGMIKRLEIVADDDTKSEIEVTMVTKQTTGGVKSHKVGRAAASAAGTTFEMRLMRVRKNATVRERRRLAEVNLAYTELSRQVPQQLLGNATKLEVLRGAAQYIHLLMVMLGKTDIVCEDHAAISNASTTMMDSDENTSPEWCTVERRELNNNILEYDNGVTSVIGVRNVGTSVSTHVINGILSYSTTR